MCLYSTTKRFKIADRDITCYKVLSIPDTYFEGVNDSLATPYTNTIVTKDIWQGKTFLVSDGKIESKKIEEGCFNGLYEITKGVIHTFKYRFDAIKNLSEESILFECSIPKGTKYIEGGDGYNSCYVSEKIKFIKKL